MRLKPSYIVVTLSVVAVAAIGSVFSSAGMPWYQQELVRPDITPPGWAFPVAWNLIFILGIISAVLAWEHTKGRIQKLIAGLFIANGVLNVAWSLLFFVMHHIGGALIEMIVLECTTLAMIILLWNRVRTAAVLLIPYLLWVGFATFLTWEIMKLNF